MILTGPVPIAAAAVTAAAAAIVLAVRTHHVDPSHVGGGFKVWFSDIRGQHGLWGGDVYQ